MLYYEFKVADEVYKLRLNMRGVVALEEDLGYNPLFIFANEANKHTPTAKEMITVLAAALKEYHNGADAYAIFDNWIAEGHIINEFVEVIVKLYQNSGLFKVNEKN